MEQDKDLSVPRTYSLLWTEHQRLRREAIEREESASHRLRCLLNLGRAAEKAGFKPEPEDQ